MDVSIIKLDVMQDGTIAVGANNHTLDELVKIRGAQRFHAEKDGRTIRWITLPPTRLAILCAESMGEVETTAEYNLLRTSVMSATPKELEEWYRYAPVLRPERTLTVAQTHFCAIALDKPGMLNGSEQGTGKTIMTIALLHAWRMKYGVLRTLLVPLKTGIDQWTLEFECTLFRDDMPACVRLLGTLHERCAMVEEIKKYPRAYVVAITNYEMLEPMQDSLMRFNPEVVVFDESWKIKTPAAHVTKAALRIARRVPRVLCLNGTPAGNHAGDFYTQISAVAGTEYAGTHSSWMNNYTEAQTQYIGNGRTVKRFVGSKNETGLLERIEPYYWRATKASSTDLPPKLPTETVELRLFQDQANLYRMMKDHGESIVTGDDHSGLEDAEIAEMRSELAEEGLSLAGAALTGLRLQQICSGFLPMALTHQLASHVDRVHPNATIDEEMRVWRFPTRKDDWLKQWIEDTLLHSSEKVIIWCNFNADVIKIARYAEDILGSGSVARLYNGPGALPFDSYPAMRESFNRRDGRIKLLAAQIKKVAFGQNLQGGDHNIYYSHTWRIVERMQSEDRTHRIGRVGVVSYRNLASTKPNGDNTIDGEIVASNTMKMNFAARIVRDTAIWNRL